MRNRRDPANTLIGITIAGGTVTGFASLIMALFPFINGDFIGTGICLAAAALSFGLLANAILRD